MMKRNTTRTGNPRKKREIRGAELSIRSDDFWLNIVDFMQQYWALIEPQNEGDKVVVYFLNDGSNVFASMEFDSLRIAEKALIKNGFKKYNDPLERYTEYLKPPGKPFTMVHRSQSESVKT
jgi:hypothetical protein